ncbi:S8 family serine peptidase [Gracilibacillus timonensis]|uniref:S8 family serine peptidase n=1 Tax=Gracilibacillus timonensis TaxID=1816696 RepID=UPI000826DBC8|nr:S8 family serine peptidase [Gracilibacillus timonensis]
MSFLLSLMLFTGSEDYSLIIEVENDPHDAAEQIETYYPQIDILAVYDTIFNGVAIKTDQRNLKKLERRSFIKKSYPVQTYQTQTVTSNINESIPFLIPDDLPYSGKGVKVGVIDTGIDYSHPDLQKNYQGGYDLVDLDDDPMETKVEDGLPTNHGSHVAGIIAADGEMQGVAPDAELYAYRALGPGGTGSSIQVMAAIEQAVKDEMDIINLSLGNSINGPDWPTSVAVNRAVEQGVSVVIANGNTGPELWTVGSPATADHVISVGASTPELQQPYLYDRFQDKTIELAPMQGSAEWELEKDLKVTTNQKQLKHHDRILVVKRSDVPFAKLALEAERQGATALLIANKEPGFFQGAVEAEVSIPVAAISQEDGEWLEKNQGYLQIKQNSVSDTITDFSSRGPVTVNWAIKPEIVAPGANILSTVPGGYQALSGTSMASPHVAGVLALIKEAHPDWTPAQLKAAVLTTAKPLPDYLPLEQGAGKINPRAAIETATLLDHSLLSFGKKTEQSEQTTETITVYNVSNQTQQYAFHLPKQKQAIRFQLPKSFTLEPNESKQINIKATIRQTGKPEPINQGYLFLNDQPLPYMYVSNNADIPQAMGLELDIIPFEDSYQYQLYLVEAANKVTIDLYDPVTFAFVTTAAEVKDAPQGVLEGEINQTELLEHAYIANVTVETTTGQTYQYQASWGE